MNNHWAGGGCSGRCVKKASCVVSEQGFSLIELLTVMGIISVLASLMGTGLIAARDSARKLKCIANERQLNLTWHLYSDDNSGSLVRNGYIKGGGDIRSPLWVQGYYNHNVHPPDSTNSALILDERFALFAPYLRTLGAYKCPSDTKAVRVREKDPMVKLRSYAMNWNLGWDGETEGGGTPTHPVLKVDAIRSPSTVLVFTDVRSESICWPFFGVPTNAWFFMFPASFHRRAASVSFADGRIDSKRWQDSRTFESQAINWHTHFQPSEANVDLVWLQEHVDNE